jgi:aspartyl-tRNA(Asn)/glutamyl-tRNA(Gln) amidotransferase subunit B
MGDFFEATIHNGAPAKAASNWIMGELSAYMNTHNLEIEDVPLSPERLAHMIELVENGTISGKIAKSVFEKMLETGEAPEEIVREQGITQISDEEELDRLIGEVIMENPDSVDDYRGGKEKALGFLVGQVMRKTQGRANPQLVNEMLRRSLEG